MIDISRAVFAQSEYRKTPDVVRQGVRDRDSLASDLTFRTLFAREEDAEAFLEEAVNLRSPGRRDWKIAIPTEMARRIVIGNTIRIRHSRFGLRDGKDFIVKGLRLETGSILSRLTLYGPK